MNSKSLLHALFKGSLGTALIGFRSYYVINIDYQTEKHVQIALAVPIAGDIGFLLYFKF